MLDDKICELREKLNKSIMNDEDYSVIYDISVALDRLIAEYYRKVYNIKPSDLDDDITNEIVTLIG